MAVFAVFVICIQTLLTQPALGRCANRLESIYAPTTAPFVPPASSGSFFVTSSSPIAPTGVSVKSDNVYDGIIGTVGTIPLLGAVGIEGELATTGKGNGCLTDDVLTRDTITCRPRKDNVIIKHPVPIEYITDEVIVKRPISCEYINEDILVKRPLSYGYLNDDIIIKAPDPFGCRNDDIIIAEKRPVVSNVLPVSYGLGFDEVIIADNLPLATSILPAVVLPVAVGYYPYVCGYDFGSLLGYGGYGYGSGLFGIGYCDFGSSVYTYY